jgi:hypothetical protein
MWVMEAPLRSAEVMRHLLVLLEAPWIFAAVTDFRTMLLMGEMAAMSESPVAPRRASRHLTMPVALLP